MMSVAHSMDGVVGSLDLGPKARVELRDIMKPLFTSAGDIKTLVNQCDKNVADIAEANTIGGRLLEMIETAEKQGWTVELLQASIEERPNDINLLNFADQYGIDVLSRDSTEHKRRETAIKFMGRESQWQQVKTLLGIEIPRHFIPPEENSTEFRKSTAVSWRVNNENDYAEYLASAMCFWIRNGCQLEQQSHECLVQHHSFVWSPAFKSTDDVFKELAIDLGNNYSGFDARILEGVTDSESFDTGFAQSLTSSQNRGLAADFSCIATVISSKTGNYRQVRALADEFCDRWNQLQWSQLDNPLLFVVLDKRRVSYLSKLRMAFNKLVSAYVVKSDTFQPQPIDKYTQNCFANWFEYYAKLICKQSQDEQWREYLKDIAADSWQDIDYAQLREKLVSSVR